MTLLIDDSLMAPLLPFFLADDDNDHPSLAANASGGVLDSVLGDYGYHHPLPRSKCKQGVRLGHQQPPPPSVASNARRGLVSLSNGYHTPSVASNARRGLVSSSNGHYHPPSPQTRAGGLSRPPTATTPPSVASNARRGLVSSSNGHHHPPSPQTRAWGFISSSNSHYHPPSPQM
jgi:hypothetical protein